MSNKSRTNSAHFTLNQLTREGRLHSARIQTLAPEKTRHGVFITDAVKFLKKLPDNSIQLILIDPPYNLDLAEWDTFEVYLDWARQWLDEVYRVLSETGSCVIFGGFQFQDLKQGDLLEILHYCRHETDLRLINLVVWYYKNGQSAHRFFANRHEEAIWLSKTKKYYFDLDAVRIPYDEKTRRIYSRDKRLNPATLAKGKNPTNVWEIGRLNGNAKERVGHPTQKPVELIRRFVRGLSFPGSVVLDFFAGSGTTGRVCIEEGRHSLMVDQSSSLLDYLDSHLAQMEDDEQRPSFEVMRDPDLASLLDSIL